MTSRVITIRLEIPDGVEVRIGGAPPDDGEPLPLPDWAVPDAPASTVRTIAAGRNGSPTGTCPVHHLPWRIVPAGISKKTGRPYAAFPVCPEPGCEERPPLSRRTAS
jgi:hypothetical protein